jgi:hypothetical protein
MIRVVLPPQLQALARVGREVTLDVEAPVTRDTVLDALETHYPVLLGLVRDPATFERRPRVRFFACERDLSHEPADAALPEAVAAGAEPLLIVAAISGG